jgi:hypothetical protein
MAAQLALFVLTGAVPRGATLFKNPKSETRKPHAFHIHHLTFNIVVANAGPAYTLHPWALVV